MLTLQFIIYNAMCRAMCNAALQSPVSLVWLRGPVHLACRQNFKDRQFEINFVRIQLGGGEPCHLTVYRSIRAQAADVFLQQLQRRHVGEHRLFDLGESPIDDTPERKKQRR